MSLNLQIAVVLLVVFPDMMAIAQDTEFNKKTEIRTIIAASNMLHQPFSSWTADNKAIGIEVDIVEAAAAKLGFKVDWIERPFAELLDAIKNGEIDVAVSTIGITDERKTIVAFSEPYYETSIVALVNPDSTATELSSLANARIGADNATTSFMAARKQWPNATIVGEVADDLTWPHMLKQGMIDAFIVDASDQQRIEFISKIKLRRLEQPISIERFGIAVSKNATDLKSAINLQVREFKPTIGLRVGGEFQFATPLGVRVSSLGSPSARLVNYYIAAGEQYRNNPGDADAVIWFGRRAGYLQRMNEAIRIFSIGVEKHAEDARMYRHRGHRYISTRQFDKAIADFEQAVKLIAGKEDQIEPDGAPNPQGIPLTTLHGNIWYHLGLAYYLKNDMDNALRCYRECQKLSRNDDGVVSSAHWLHMILGRKGEGREAATLVANIKPDMKIIENFTYHKMCLYYAGQIAEAKLLSQSDKGNGADEADMNQSVADVLLYGLGNHYLYARQNHTKARELYQSLFRTGSPFSFAYIAAESDYLRLFGHNVHEPEIHKSDINN